ncbi:MAG: hypothetical protein MR914_04330 [Clostridiales bacterium]|nr:hypothetical protein [Clostridiales bacterium]
MRIGMRVGTLVLALILALGTCLTAGAETYPVYKVTVRPAWLFSKADYSAEDIIRTVPMDSLVLVAEKSERVSLVYTKEGLFGYMNSDYIQPTGKEYTVDFAITPDKISENEDRMREMRLISTDPYAVLPDTETLQRTYPATLVQGRQAYDLDGLLNTLLGEGYIRQERTSGFAEDAYESRDSEKPYRYIHVYDDTGELSYYDSMVSGERDGEYQPPRMNMPKSESEEICRALLKDVLPSDWLAHRGVAWDTRERWGGEDRWLTDAEYKKSILNTDVHRFEFEHWTEDGIAIYGDRILAAVGVNGLDRIMMNWHEYRIETETQIELMPLDEALSMANRTRKSEAVLLYAAPVYSNWLTGDDRFNLSWLLVMNKGDYIVDCVLKEHKCDSYEFY